MIAGGLIFSFNSIIPTILVAILIKQERWPLVVSYIFGITISLLFTAILIQSNSPLSLSLLFIRLLLKVDRLLHDLECVSSISLETCSTSADHMKKLTVSEK
ncbi:hypothetical protein ACQKL5_09425 [Peribacillus sp. NPDC097675]|uniref:hypothetical protein n=1 Tax=Peribacillus sp. NPDC097675 TaxID=3390618 RepID=UPI003D085C4C